MSLLVHREEMVRGEAHRRVQVGIKQFRDAIRPLYAPSLRKALPSHVGTCTLVRKRLGKSSSAGPGVVGGYVST